ncbi:hypothetical protein YQE_01457, partial [Dendroctonus ponderosae]
VRSFLDSHTTINVGGVSSTYRHSKSVRSFLDSHTTINVGGVSSTYRHSKSVPFRWKNDLNYTEI